MSALPDRNARLAWAMAAVVGGMLGLAYASVPLYEMFCKVTGFGGTPLVAQAGDRPVLDRTVTVRFDSNVDPNMPWRFEPEKTEIEVKIGEVATAYYKVTNEAARETLGQAAYNVTPTTTGAYFQKINCFCLFVMVDKLRNYLVNKLQNIIDWFTLFDA